jgi:hypothetical protein
LVVHPVPKGGHVGVAPVGEGGIFGDDGGAAAVGVAPVGEGGIFGDDGGAAAGGTAAVTVILW